MTCRSTATCSFMSVEQTRGRLDCGTEGVQDRSAPNASAASASSTSPTSHKPKQIAAVQTCRGSHTHTLVAEPEGHGEPLRLWFRHRYGPRGRGAGRDAPASHPKEDPNTALFSIDVIQVPLASPDKARIVSRPRIFADPNDRRNLRPVAGRQTRRRARRRTPSPISATTSRCSRRSVSPPARARATASCSTSRIRCNPVRLDAVSDKNFAYWHSATFNNDRHEGASSPTSGAAARVRAAAPRDPAQLGRRRDLRHRRPQAAASRATTRCRRRRPSRRTASRTTARSSRCPGRDIMVAGVVSGRHLGVRLHRLRRTRSRSRSSIAARLDAKNLITGGFWSCVLVQRLHLRHRDRPRRRRLQS